MRSFLCWLVHLILRNHTVLTASFSDRLVELQGMADRIIGMRKALVAALKNAGGCMHVCVYLCVCACVCVSVCVCT